MRIFAGLLAYLVGVSAIIGMGIVGLMALKSSIERMSSAPIVAVRSHKEPIAKQTPSAPIVAVRSHKEPPLAKPVKQAMVDQKKARRDQKRKLVHVTRKRTHEAPTVVASHNAYGYAEEPHGIDPQLFPIFGH